MAQRRRQNFKYQSIFFSVCESLRAEWYISIARNAQSITRSSSINIRCFAWINQVRERKLFQLFVLARVMSSSSSSSTAVDYTFMETTICFGLSDSRPSNNDSIKTNDIIIVPIPSRRPSIQPNWQSGNKMIIWWRRLLHSCLLHHTSIRSQAVKFNVQAGHFTINLP